MPRKLHPLGDGAAVDAAGGDNGPNGACGSVAAGEGEGQGKVSCTAAAGGARCAEGVQQLAGAAAQLTLQRVVPRCCTQLPAVGLVTFHS